MYKVNIDIWICKYTGLLSIGLCDENRKPVLDSDSCVMLCREDVVILKEYLSKVKLEEIASKQDLNIEKVG